MPPYLIEKIIPRKKDVTRKHGQIIVVFRLWLIPLHKLRHAWRARFLYPFQRMRKRKLNEYKKTECTQCMHSAKFVVGVARLELAALRSRTVRATKLRYTPIN